MEHRDDGSCEQGAAHPPRTTWRGRSDRELVVAMRADVSLAFEEFVARYRPLLLARSRRFDLSQWEREDCVADTLEAMMLRLVRPDIRAPEEMAAYLTRALHNRLVDIARARAAQATDECTANWSKPGADRTVAVIVPQHAVMPCDDAAVGISSGLSPAVERLARALLDPLTEDERQLIGWESNMIPHRTIAAWLGVSHAAATKRIWRLRARLREIALGHADSLAPSERGEIERIINRHVPEKSATYAGQEAIAVSGSHMRRCLHEEGGTAR